MSKSMIRSKKMMVISISVTVLMLSMIFSAWGFSTGRYDRAKTGCECHSSTADPGVTVSITGLPLEYLPDQIYALTVTVSGGPATNNGGFNLEISSGVLSPGDLNVQTDLTGIQATHLNPNQRTWAVNWQAPSAGTGEVTFWAAGNAVNGDTTNGGDGWNLFSRIVPEGIPVDTLPPEIFGISIDGELIKSVTAGTLVTLAGTVDDTTNGNSNIAGANYTIGAANWSSSTPLLPVQPPFDNPVEDASITIDTAGWLAGTYELYVYGWDEVPNYNITSVAHATLIISTELVPPEISNVLINGAAIQTYPLSSIPVLTLTATVDDSTTGNSDIGGANYTVEVQSWGTSQSMSLQNPPTSPTEVFEATITPPNEVGTYGYFVYGWDVLPNHNFTNTHEFAQLTITDDVEPEISNVLIEGIATKAVLAGTSVTLTATVDDSSTGNSNIGGANFTIGLANWSSSESMDAQDGTYDGPSEDVKITIDTTGWSFGTYELYVYARDDLPNHNTSSAAHATLIISSELIPPEISNVTIDDVSELKLMTGTTVTIKATVDDSDTGNSIIAGANFTLVSGNWDDSISMEAFDSAFDSSHEVVTYLLDTTEWSPGTYQIYVYARDGAQPENNHNVSSLAFATLIIKSPPSNVVVSVGEERGILKINWDATSDEDIAGFNIYRSTSSGEGYTKIASVGSSESSFTDSDLEDGKTYYYVITAYDSSESETSDSTEASATTLAEPSDETEDSQDLGMIIILIVVIIVILLLVMLWKRKSG
jgi:hypothetical protein